MFHHNQHPNLIYLFHWRFSILRRPKSVVPVLNVIIPSVSLAPTILRPLLAFITDCDVKALSELLIFTSPWKLVSFLPTKLKSKEPSLLKFNNLLLDVSRISITDPVVLDGSACILIVDVTSICNSSLGITTYEPDGIGPQLLHLRILISP